MLACAVYAKTCASQDRIQICDCSTYDLQVIKAAGAGLSAFLGGFARTNMGIEVALIVKWQPSCIRRGEGEGAIRPVGECEGQGGDGGCR